MARNQTGIEVNFKGFIPLPDDLTGKIETYQMVKTAHETGDYAPVLAAAVEPTFKVAEKNRRIEDEPEPPFQSGRAEPQDEPIDE